MPKAPAPPIPTPQPADPVARVAVEADVRLYRTSAGESLAGIAMRELGDEARWREISDANAGPWPELGPHDRYPPGTTIVLPA
jgi:nucleoid-associated protein YgaU